MFSQRNKKLFKNSKKFDFCSDKSKKQEKLETNRYFIENQAVPRYMFDKENEEAHLPIQRYVKNNGYTLSAPAEEGAEEGHRCLMVKDGEPASLYINRIVGDVDLKDNLKKIGIEPKGEIVDCPEGHFVKYGQGKIPKIYQRPVRRITEVIPFGERSFGQMLSFFWSSAPTREREIYGNLKLNEEGQLIRSVDNKQKAEARLRIQYNMLENVISIAKWYLQKLGSESSDATEDEFQQNKTRLDELFNRYQVNEEGLSLVMMGTDTFRSIRLIYEIINGRLENLDRGVEASRLKEDKKIALEMAIEDLQYRFEQIKSEQSVLNTLALEPYMPTGCNASADRRFGLLGFNASNNVAVTFENKNVFGNLISWAWHYATEIKQQLTKDSLLIEDAVGKSLNEDEMMNAHWSAHIYGADEGASDEFGLALLDGGNAEHRMEKIIMSKCRFNRMSDNFRSLCLENVDRDRTWKLKYQIWNEVIGTLEVLIENNLIKYKFIPQEGKHFTAAMQHFLLETADSIVEDFVITTIVGKVDTIQNRPYEEIIAHIFLSERPGTRVSISNYLTEEVNIRNS